MWYRATLNIFSIFIFIVLVSCASIPQNSVEYDKASQKHIDCEPIEDKDHKELSMLRCSISYEQLNFFSLPGTKLIMTADSGERIELWWTIDWFGRGHFFPRLRFALMYFNPEGKEEQRGGVRIGECRFSRGCNHGIYTGPDLNKNNIPDYFTMIVWDNFDYGNDSGVEGYMDHYRHTYKPRENKYEVIRYLYFYPEKCIPPISPGHDVCHIRDECKPPYKIKEERSIESRSF
ncbi:MAG TPA: hypothetical protein PKW07_12045 [Syntrophorhabdaceae bacterium]|nr:hypothetical protein [Syntrophorhabdaceae bacterium]